MSTEAYFARVLIGDEVNEDKYRDVTVHGRMSPDDESISVSINSIGMHFYMSLTPAKARELAAAIAAAAEASPGDET